MMREMKLAAFAVAVTLVLGGLAAAQDRDDDDDSYYQQGNPAQARQYGYQNGYRDGYRKGRHEGRENDPNDYRNPDWRQATRGHERWMGPVNWFQTGYREGYPNGFQAGYQSANYRDGDDDDRDAQPYYGGNYPYGGNDPYYGNRPWGGSNVGYNTGYQDGSSVAREDSAQRKPYNPKPRGRYDDEDHGYRREYGGKGAYKAQYANGYRAGYQAAFGNRY